MADEEKKKTEHALTDHLYGWDVAHVHADDSDHDHDHDFDADDGPLEDNPLWLQDNVALTTVGIDIGSSGTQVIFSKVHLRRLAEDLTSRYYVVSRDTLFQSQIALTPYQSEERIDDAALGAIIDDAYGAAGFAPERIDIGVVILTGEALRRENAQTIAAILAEKGGEFLTAAAGHHMEAMLAAYGSGAARVSSDESKRILNVDIGGGTTKLGLVENGRVIATAAVYIGGRLQVVEAGKIVRLDPAGKHHAGRAGFSWRRGDTIDPSGLQKVADGMADALVSAIATKPLPPDIGRLYLTDPIADLGRVDGLMFSGGAISAISVHGSARPSTRASMAGLSPGRCCPPASAFAQPRSAPRNTASSFRAIRATSPIRGNSCRGAICRSCNRPLAARKRSIRTRSRRQSAAT